jgi:signal transduction histidine kinase
VDVDFEKRDWTYVVANSALTSYFPEYDEQKSLIGASAVTDLHITSSEVDEWMAHFQMAKEEGVTVQHEVKIRERYLDMRFLHINHLNGKREDNNRFVYFAQDVSETRRLEEELIKKKENLENEVKKRTLELEMALQVKSRFLATMSHEIRTPLFGIMGTLTLLGDKHMDTKALEMIRTAAVCADQLLVVINDILDFSKTEENKMEVEKQPFSLQQVIQDSLELVSADPLRKTVELLYDYYNDLPNCIFPISNNSNDEKISIADNIIGDMTRVRQVLVNLFTNAVKFSSNGAIILRVRTLDVDDIVNDGYKVIEISVEDNGIGVGDRTKERIFQPFVQEDISTTRRYGGSGLGLSISKRLCQLMGGDMNFHSIEGKGSSESSYHIISHPSVYRIYIVSYIISIQYML